MMVRKGFTLIELMIGLLIASLLSVVLYRMFSQTMRVAHMSSGLIEDYSDVLIMSNQMERDITSIVVLKEHAKIAEQQAQAQAQEQQKQAGQPGAEGAAAAPPKASSIDFGESGKEQEGEKKEEEEERLAFAGVIKDNKLSTLSFVCTNALPQVDSAGSRLVRVRYFLVADADDASLHQLMREERRYQAKNDAEPQPDKSRAYVIMPRIETITVRFYGTLYSKKGEAGGTAQEESKTLLSWGNEEQRKALKRLVPEYLEISGSRRSRGSQVAIPFSFFIPIPAGIAEGIEARAKERREQEKQK